MPWAQKLKKPSVLLSRICYPDHHPFRSKQTAYSCAHEKDSLNSYLQKHRSEHTISINEVGLIIHPEYPYFGTSPDSIVNCHVCGEDCVEVKCPYCVYCSMECTRFFLGKNLFLRTLAARKSFYKNYRSSN